MIVGYARVSTQGQEIESQRNILLGMGVDPDRLYVDVGVSGTKRDRPGLREAMAAVRAGDVFVVTKLDRLARSVPDAHDLIAALTEKGVTLNIGGTQHDPTSPTSRLLVNVLAMVAEFERDLISSRTREGMARASVRKKLRGRAPSLNADADAEIVAKLDAGDRSVADIAGMFNTSRSGVYRAAARHRARTGGSDAR